MRFFASNRRTNPSRKPKRHSSKPLSNAPSLSSLSFVPPFFQKLSIQTPNYTTTPYPTCSWSHLTRSGSHTSRGAKTTTTTHHNQKQHAKVNIDRTHTHAENNKQNKITHLSLCKKNNNTTFSIITKARYWVVAVRGPAQVDTNNRNSSTFSGGLFVATVSSLETPCPYRRHAKEWQICL